MDSRSIGNLEGRELFDSSGYKIGNIEVVYRGEGLGFALVTCGMFGTIRRVVPLAEALESVNGELVVPYSKDKVTLCPPAESNGRLSQGERERLCRYYRLDFEADSGARSQGLSV